MIHKLHLKDEAAQFKWFTNENKGLPSVQEEKDYQNQSILERIAKFSSPSFSQNNSVVQIGDMELQ